jgi:predicted NBD/HSP70 family sugar kinase
MQSSNLCRCGNYGCLETYTSISRVFGKGLKDAQSHLNKLFRKKAAEFLEYIETLSVALTNIVNAINPEYLILGGELSGLDVEFYELLEKKIKGRALENSGKILKVLPPTFTHDTYLYGALYAVIEEYFIPNVISKVAR